MKKIKVCADPFPPYQYIDENGEPAGKDYEFVVNKLKKAGYEPEIWIAPWNQIYPEFESGEQDVLFQAQDSPERLEKFYLSKCFRYAVTEVLTANRKLCAVRSFEELENYKLGVIEEFANGPEIDSLPDNCKVGFRDAEELLDGICTGKVDAGVMDQGVKEYLIKKEMEIYVIPGLTYQRPLYVMFGKEKQRDEFDAIN